MSSKYRPSRRLTMRPAMYHPSISAVRAGALFVSALQRCEQPSAEQVRQSVAAAVHAFGEHGCAERVAEEFGDHPETAVPRMRWALQLVGEAFSDRGQERTHLPALRSASYSSFGRAA
jgi:hypothetical protein